MDAITTVGSEREQYKEHTIKGLILEGLPTASSYLYHSCHSDWAVRQGFWMGANSLRQRRDVALHSSFCGHGQRSLLRKNRKGSETMRSRIVAKRQAYRTR
jgi:hypothetical protein